MQLKPDFSFRPLPALKSPTHTPFARIPNPLGPIRELPGTWSGKGFNTIWRPNSTPGQDHFLELNLTDETLQFEAISGPIPNRGLLQPDINMFGITYLQQIKDGNLGAGLHIEPGIWAVVPLTTNPAEPPTVVRMASIPHGTTILAQGASFQDDGPPPIPTTNITPFVIGNTAKTIPFPEVDLSKPTQFRSDPAQLVGITQAMIDNPNSVLTSALAGQTVLETTSLVVSSDPSSPVLGGGTDNMAFLQGTQTAGPNAHAVIVTATFWIEKVKGTPDFLQLQYTQMVLLNFSGLSWPHVTVATLRKVASVDVPLKYLDPDMPDDLYNKLQSEQ